MASRRAQVAEPLEDPLNEAQDIVNQTSEALAQSQIMQRAGEALASAKIAAGGAAEGVAQSVQGAAKAGRTAAGEVVAAGEQAVGLGRKGPGQQQEEEEEGPPPPQDEVDATPQEQMFRHKVDLEEHGAPGTVQHAKETLVHAVEGVSHRIEDVAEKLHLTHHTQQAQQGGAGAGGEELHMAKTAEGRDVGGEGREEEEEEGPPPKHDEVDASPEEQFVRHHVRWPEQEGAGAGAQGQPSRLHRLRETAVHAAEGAAHRIEGVAESLHIVGHSQHGQHKAPAHGANPAVPGATAEQRTGEPLQMAKAAEGRNVAQDDPVMHAVHAALKPEPQDKAVGEVSAFPETLDDAIKAAQVKGEDGGGPAAGPSSAGGNGGDPNDTNNTNPFIVGARARL